MAQRGRRQVDDLLLLALACGATVDNAARSANVSAATVYRRLQETEFCRKLQQLRADMVRRNASTLTAAATEATKTLIALLKADAPAPVRLGAARSILEFGMKLRETAELEACLATLEMQLEEMK